MDDDLLPRIDERLKTVQHEVHGLKQALDDYLERAEFWAHFQPVQRLVFGTVALICGTVLAAIVYLVVRQ